MEILKANYPFMDKGLTDAEKDARCNLWCDMFANDDYRIVGAAVKAYIATDEKGFPPNVGIIKSHIRKLTEPEEMTEQEAINLIMKAVSNGIYNSGEEYRKLPPVLQRLVGSPARLREWAAMDSDTVNSVVSSNLMRSYKAIQSREKEISALPGDVKCLLGSITDKFRLTEPEEMTEQEVNARRNEILNRLGEGSY